MGDYKENTKSFKKTDNKKNKKTGSSEKKQSKSNSSGGLYYSFMTIILLLCLVQITVSAVLNVSKIVAFNGKIVQITKQRDAARALNAQLKDNISNFSDVAALEAIARNNLKRSSADEVMVIINEPKENPQKEKQKKFGGFFSD